MREIKFRAWDKEQNKFFEPTYEGYAGKVECLTISLTGRLTKRTFYQPAVDESCFEGRYILSQFTGLKDKSGKEIYEGDILSEKWKCSVYYNDGTYMVKFALNAKLNKPKSLSKYLKGRKIAGSEDRDCAIIGNIYENPELLN